MRKKVLTAIVLTVTMAISALGISIPAEASSLTPTADYILTIPATLSVKNVGWNETAGIVAKADEGCYIPSDITLTVTAESENGWVLKSGTNEIGYNLTTASVDYSSTAEPATWAFSGEEMSAFDYEKEDFVGTTKSMGIIVDDYSNSPAGTYTDTVIFTASTNHKVILIPYPEGYGDIPIIYDPGQKWSDVSQQLNNYDITIYMGDFSHYVLYYEYENLALAINTDGNYVDSNSEIAPLGEDDEFMWCH